MEKGRAIPAALLSSRNGESDLQRKRNPKIDSASTHHALALQLHFCHEMSALCGGLMCASPQGPCDDMSGLDVATRHAGGDTPNLLHGPADQRA
jgi:hypothetical protein